MFFMLISDLLIQRLGSCATFYLTLIISHVLHLMHSMVGIGVICNFFFICHWQALGCLLYRICYFKSAFDGESKLQILNGNYRIPEQPKYSTAVTGLIKDMLEASPNARPDITQARALIDWPFISMILG